jgi:hypothetical protein
MSKVQNKKTGELLRESRFLTPNSNQSLVKYESNNNNVFLHSTFYISIQWLFSAT